MPHPQFDYSRWQQNLVGVLSIDMKYKPTIKLGKLPNSLILINY